MLSQHINVVGGMGPRHAFARYDFELSATEGTATHTAVAPGPFNWTNEPLPRRCAVHPQVHVRIAHQFVYAGMRNTA